MSYVTGFLIPVKAENKERYIKSAVDSWPLFQKHGALSQMETWGDNVPDGEVTSFPLAVQLEPGEVVVFSWLIWPDKATADTAWQAMTDDPDFEGMDMPFDGKRMMWGGFQPIFEGRVGA
jgi:uncharacterized protein YbaA (DUF1428 family)